MHRLGKLLSRPVPGSWPGTVACVIISSLTYSLGLVVLTPFLGTGARSLRFPFGWFWGWRNGVWGGVIAAIFVEVVVANTCVAAAGLVTIGFPNVLFFIANNMITGASSAG